MADVTETNPMPAYYAATGISIESRKRKVRLEPGDPLPDDLTKAEIDDLLAIKAIQPKGGSE
jgi:hypothetical protein